MRFITLAIAAAVSAGALAVALAAESGPATTPSIVQDDLAAGTAAAEDQPAASDEGTADVAKRKALTMQDFGENEGSEDGTESGENESGSQSDD